MTKITRHARIESTLKAEAKAFTSHPISVKQMFSSLANQAPNLEPSVDTARQSKELGYISENKLKNYFKGAILDVVANMSFLYLTPFNPKNDEVTLTKQYSKSYYENALEAAHWPKSEALLNKINWSGEGLSIEAFATQFYALLDKKGSELKQPSSNGLINEAVFTSFISSL